MLIYSTNEWKGYGKQNYYHYEYRLENGQILKYKCNRQRVYNGEENEWIKNERLDTSWKLGDPGIPEWLTKHIPK